MLFFQFINVMGGHPGWWFLKSGLETSRPTENRHKAASYGVQSLSYFGVCWFSGG